jgi:predicted Zn-ribbon and HTH transcriptional regulator
MYFAPHPATCKKCGFREMYGPDDAWTAPVVGSAICCPRCWEDWLAKNIGQMKYDK